ncbi:MAG: type III-B CRISPR module RAMP protein Cmr1 [Armatimonadetes bacterium]|nr:type III-B CRISPR module RAMP protein Cmr1 [Armatimonadota bacterium]
MGVRQSTITAPVWSEPARDTHSLSLKLKVVTPLFGGGYQAREIDDLNVIRPAAIRGQLRYWWRATAGAKFKTAEEMYEAEWRIWGSATETKKKEDDPPKGGPSKVGVRVKLTDQGSKRKLSEVVPRSTPREGPREGYFTFPFQEQRGDNPAPEAYCRIGVQFELSLCMDAELDEQTQQQIENAVKAWIAFGGVGARTRRGCGALQVTEDNSKTWLPPPDASAREKWFKSLVSPGDTLENLPTLTGGRIVLGGSPQDAKQLWSSLGTFWARFRKGQVGRIEYSPMSGSKWNDYDNLDAHRRGSAISLAKPYLGLPIIFQDFKDGKFHGNVEAGESGRMASPIIVKPLALSNGHFLPMVAVLKAHKIDKVKIKDDLVDLLPPAKEDPVMKELFAQDVYDKELLAQDVYDAVIVAAKGHVGTEVVSL